MSDRIVHATRIALPLSLVLTIGIPLLSAVLSYGKSMGDTRAEIEQVRLESEQKFVKKDEMKAIVEKLGEANEKLAGIAGYLKAIEKNAR